MIQVYLMVALGGAVGSMLRFALSEVMSRLLGSGFPWGTMMVNVAGSLLIGVLAALAVPDGWRMVAETQGRALLMVGFCGGFTTFSSFSLQTLVLVQEGHWPLAMANVVASVVLCIGATVLGFQLVNGLAGR